MAERARKIEAPRLAGTGKAALPGDVFGERFRPALVYEAARAELLARRSGTAATLSRGDVRGGGTKPWRQKGTGRARAGSIRAPQWTGGGTVFGPTPRHYTVKVNRKAHRRALRAALSVHAERGSVAIVDAGGFEEPATRRAADALDGWNAERPVLVLLDESEEPCAKSFRNLDGVSVLPTHQAGVADVVRAASLVISEAALERLGRSAGAETRPERQARETSKSETNAEASA